jgi:hypothetical protein
MVRGHELNYMDMEQWIKIITLKAQDLQQPQNRGCQGCNLYMKYSIKQY